MDLPAPSLEISTIGAEEGPYDMGREDVEGKWHNPTLRLLTFFVFSSARGNAPD